MKDGDLRVWWIPQIPMESFYVSVDTVHEGVKVMGILAKYDMFQLENNIKPDYANAGGLEIFEDGEWCDWYIECDALGYCDDPEEYVNELKINPVFTDGE